MPTPSPQDLSKSNHLPVLLDPAEKKANSITTDNATELQSVSPAKIAIESFLPLLQALDSPGVQLIDGEFHLRGPISRESLEKLSIYARNVTCFTLADEVLPVDPGTWLHLIQLLTRYHTQQNLDGIFPSLEMLHIQSAASLANLQAPLFAVSSLRVLIVSKCNFNPETHFEATVTSFHILADGAPDLYLILFDASLPYTPSIHLACMRFSQLRVLRLDNLGPKFDWTMLRDLGQLQYLDTLHLHARTAHYTSRAQCDSSAHIEEKMQAILQYSESGSESAPNKSHLISATRASFPDSIHSPGANELSVLDPPTLSDELNEPNPCSSAIGFYNLQHLHIRAKMDLMSDLIDFIGSKKMVEIFLMLITAQSPQSPAAASSPATNEELSTSSTKTPFETDFHALIKKTLSTGAQSLKKMRVACIRNTANDSHILIPGYFSQGATALGLELPTLQALISHSSLRYLEIWGWQIKYDLSLALSQIFTTLPQPSNLESLYLTPNSSDVSLRRLRTVLAHCPSLVSFRCRFRALSLPPSGSDANDGVVFGLKVLDVGSSEVSSRRLPYLIKIAQYLDALCPNLQNIEAEGSLHAKEWKDIHDLVKMCQQARSNHPVPKVLNSAELPERSVEDTE